MKAWTTTARLQYGDYNAVRRRREIVETAVADWDRRVDEIRARPSALHLSGPEQVREIAGIVVCPNVPYVLPGICTDEVVNGVRKVATLAELGRGLESAAYIEQEDGLVPQLRRLQRLFAGDHNE